MTCKRRKQGFNECSAMLPIWRSEMGDFKVFLYVRIKLCGPFKKSSPQYSGQFKARGIIEIEWRAMSELKHDPSTASAYFNSRRR
jgi:hypothetical protein